MYVARNRQRRNPFEQRARERRAAQPAPAAPEPKPEPLASPDPAHEQPDHSEPRGAEHMRPLPDAVDFEREDTTMECTCGPGDGCSLENCKGRPLSEEETIVGPDEAVIPLGDLREVSERQREKLAKAMDAPSDAITPAAQKRGRGRPRPQATIDRDNRVLEAVSNAEQAGVSKADLAGLLSEKEQQVYTSLRRLQQDGKVESRHAPDKGYRWFTS